MMELKQQREQSTGEGQCVPEKKKRRFSLSQKTNLFLVLIILAVRYILMHGSRKSGRCTGDCGGCGMGCASRFSPEKRQFDEIMKNRKKK